MIGQKTTIKGIERAEKGTENELGNLPYTEKCPKTSTGEVMVLISTAEAIPLETIILSDWKASMGPRRSSASCVSTGYSLGKQGATSKNMAGPKDATNMPESGQSYGGKLVDQSLTYSLHVAFPWIWEDDERCVLVLPARKVPRLTPYLMQTSWLYFPSASEPGRAWFCGTSWSISCFLQTASNNGVCVPKWYLQGVPKWWVAGNHQL